MTKAELIILAESLGIEGTSSDKLKAEIIALILNA